MVRRQLHTSIITSARVLQDALLSLETNSCLVFCLRTAVNTPTAPTLRHARQSSFIEKKPLISDDTAGRFPSIQSRDDIISKRDADFARGHIMIHPVSCLRTGVADDKVSEIHDIICICQTWIKRWKYTC